MSTEIVRVTRVCWMRIRRNPLKLYDQLELALSLKTRLVKAEVIEALLYGCSIRGPFARNTTPNSAPYTTGFRFALSGHSASKRPDHQMTSYNRALEITEWESTEITLRTRRLLCGRG